MGGRDNILKLMMFVFTIGAFVALSSMPALCGDGAVGAIAGAHDLNALNGAEIKSIAPNWGDASYISVSLSPFSFVGYTATDDSYILQFLGNRYCSLGCFLNATVNFPTGAEIRGIELDAYDSGENDVCLILGYCPFNTTGCTGIGSACSSGTSGFTWPQNWTLSHTVDNFNNAYIFQIQLWGGAEYRLVGAHAYYQLQVSPDPVYATFSDVPVGHWAHQYVEALYASGITEGYSDGTFRPGQPVLRGQMAAFLSKALGLHWPY